MCCYSSFHGKYRLNEPNSFGQAPRTICSHIILDAIGSRSFSSNIDLKQVLASEHAVVLKPYLLEGSTANVPLARLDCFFQLVHTSR